MQTDFDLVVKSHPFSTLDAAWLHQARAAFDRTFLRWMRRIVLFLAAATLALLGWILIARGFCVFREVLNYWLPFFLCLGLWWLSFSFLFRSFLNRSQLCELLHAGGAVCISEDALSVHTQGREQASAPLGEVVSASVTGGGLVVFLKRHGFLFVPPSALSDPTWEAQAEQYLAAHGVRLGRQ